MSLCRQICPSQRIPLRSCPLVSRMMARPTPSTCVTAVGKEEDSDESQEEVDAPTERTNSAMWSMMAVMRRGYGVYTGVCGGYGLWFDLREMSAEIGEPRHVLQDASRHLQEAAWADYDAGSDRIRVRPTAPTTMPLSPSMPTRDRKAELESCKVEQLNMFFRFLPIIRKISKLYDTCDAWTLGALNETILDFMNQAAKERREKRKSEKEALKQEWISDEEIARRASASSRGPVRGIQHKKSEAKYLREKAKREERLMQSCVRSMGAAV